MTNTQLAFQFPGQGSQSLKMGFNLLEKFPDFESQLLETLSEADSVLGFSLTQLIQSGPEEKLKLTEITQPALLTVSTAIGRYLKTKGIRAQLALGHSLGEYSALVYSESIRFKDAVSMVHLRGRLMSHAVAPGTAGMAALMGASPEQATMLCKLASEKSSKVLEISLLNAPGQIVVSGHKEAIEAAVQLSREVQIRRVMPLEVSGPFHCSLLKPIQTELRKALDSIEIRRPSIPIIANVTAKALESEIEIKELLVRQVSEPVRWEASMKQAEALGFTRFIEIGSSSVLTGIASKISPDYKAQSFENISLSELQSL